MSIRMPRLLDKDFRESARLVPLQLSLSLRLHSLSTAKLILPCNAPAVSVRDLVELYDESGSVGIFRVCETTEQVGHTRMLKLEHGLCTLRDSMIPTFAFTGSVRDALTGLLGLQTVAHWGLGTVEVPEELTIVFATGYVDLLTALENLLRLLPEGYALDFDQSGSTWLLHLRALSDEDACEGRLSRNLHSVRYELDSSRLCTRVYPFGAEIEHERLSLIPLEGTDHLRSEAESLWGVVSHTFASDLIFDIPTLRDVAQLYLTRHAQPEATITVEAVDLCSATNEALDSFRLGRMCRLALPEAGLALRQRITEIQKPDVFGMPGQVLLTLASKTAPTNTSAEIDALVRQVTASKLLGGKVTEVADENRAYGTYASPIVHYFEVDDWAGVLDVRVALDPDIGVRISELLIDGNVPSRDEWRSGSFSAMPYLARDALGLITKGEHRLILHPTTGVSGEECGVNSTITMTVIEKTTSS